MSLPPRPFPAFVSPAPARRRPLALRPLPVSLTACLATLLPVLCLGLPTDATAQQPQPAGGTAVAGAAMGASSQVLPTVVVTASGFEQNIEDAPASITVIPRAELEARQFRDLTDALRNVEGVTVTGLANERDIYIRGLPGQYTLILVDGKRQGTRDARPNGSSGFEQSFIPPIEAIERIEVVRGPMSSLYGSDAMGGVINIITRKVPAKWGGSVSADYTRQQHGDSGDSHQQQIYAGGPIVDRLVGLQVWARHMRRAEDEILNGHAKARDLDLTARLAITPDQANEILLEAGRAELRRNSSPGATLATTASPTRTEHDRDHYSIAHTGRYGWANTAVSLLRETGERTNYSWPAGGGWSENPRSPQIQNTILDAKLAAPLGDHALVVGGQWNEAELTDQNPGRRTGLDEKFKATQKALFVEDEWQILDKFALTGGLRLDDHSVYGAHWSPRLYGVWRQDDHWTFKGGVSRGFRAPDIRSIVPGYATTTGGGGCTYGPNGTCGVIIGDPDLKPETSTSFELAAMWDNRYDMSASATVFYTDFKDKISNALVYDDAGNIRRWAEDPNYRLWYNYNVDQAKIRGVELNWRWRVTPTLTTRAGYTFTDSKQSGGVYDGYPLSRTPRHRLNLRGDWNASAALLVWAGYNFYGKEVNAAARSGSSGRTLADGVRQYPSYATADVGVSWDYSRDLTLNAALYNLGDRRVDYADFNTIIDGRRFWIGATYRF